jgi:hypothetical protein
MSGKVTCPQAVSRESHRTRNKNKQHTELLITTNKQQNQTSDCVYSNCPLGSPLVLRSDYEWRGCPQAVSRESHRTRNKNKQQVFV